MLFEVTVESGQLIEVVEGEGSLMPVARLDVQRQIWKTTYTKSRAVAREHPGGLSRIAGAGQRDVQGESCVRRDGRIKDGRLYHASPASSTSADSRL